MYDPQKLTGDPNNPTGLLYVSGIEASTGNYFNLLAFEKPEKLLKIKDHLPKELSGIIREFMDSNLQLDATDLLNSSPLLKDGLSDLEIMKKDLEQIGLKSNIEKFKMVIRELHIPSNYDMSSYLANSKDINTYSCLGRYPDMETFKVDAREIIERYFGDYFNQEVEIREEDSESVAVLEHVKPSDEISKKISSN